MKNVYSLFVLGLLMIGAVSAYSQAPDSAKQAEMMAKAMELAQPGPEHKILSDWAGAWDMEIKMSMEAGQPPMTMKTTAENKMILGGRFLQMQSSWEMMGMPAESFIIMGFDRRKSEFTWVGFDSYGTYFITAAGKYDEATKTITMSGTDEDPVFGVKQVYDIVVILVDADTRITKVVFKNPEFTQDKDEMTAVEVVSKRRK